MSFAAFLALLIAGAAGLIGALLYSNEALSTLGWGAALMATGRRFNAATHLRSGRKRRRSSLWAAALAGHPRGSSRWRRQRAKFLLRAVWHRRMTAAWLERLGEPDARALWAAHPRLGSKLQRPYLHCRWGVDDRLRALTTHYDAMREFFSASAREKIYTDEIVLLRRDGTESGGPLELKLIYRGQFEKEGELTLLVADAATGLALAGLTFCICGDAGHRQVWIGGLQASPGPRTRERINAATKDLHGMRPKALALWALRQLCLAWGAQRLRAVSNDAHIYNHWRKRREISALYDEFWAESGGTAMAGGWDLPIVVPGRPREEIKPSRRKAHGLRSEMLARLAPELAARCRAMAGAGEMLPADLLRGR